LFGECPHRSLISSHLMLLEIWEIVS
jgi:hypothetical protein